MNAVLTRFNPAKRVFSLINQQLLRNCQSYDYDPNKDGDIIENYQFNIMTIGINLPETKNELDAKSVEKIMQLVDKVDADDNIKGVVIHGIGGNFCKGISLPDSKNQDDYLEKIDSIKKPVFAAISGYATGFGFALALMCDFRVVETDSLVGISSDREKFPYFSKLSAERLALLIGYSNALDFILTKRLIHGQVAYNYGLATAVTEIGTVLGHCINTARAIGKFPQSQTISDKEFLKSRCFRT